MDAMKSTRIAWPFLALNFLLSPVCGASVGHSTFQQALELAQKGRKAEALELFHRLTVEDSTNLEAWNNQAGLEAALGELDEARASLEHALAIRPDLAVLSRNLEKVRSRQARLAYDSAFGTPSQLQPLALELRQKTSAVPDADLRREIDSLRLALESAREDSRLEAQLRDSLSARDREIARLREIQASAVAVVASTEAVPKSVAPTSQSSRPARRAEPAPAAVPHPDALEAVKAWAKAWSDRDVDTYLAAYVPGYHPVGVAHGDWAGKRRERILAPKWIKLDVQDPKMVLSSPDRAEVVYRQVYQAEGARLTSRKRIELTLLDGEWKIEEEKEAR
jgi:tetratricopeptide (TPR) repeat protein